MGITSIALKLLAVSQIISQREFNHNLLTSRQTWDNTYDYIIVGAGSAGCVVAARLAEDKSKTVLLLEAGGPQTIISDIPAKQGSLTGTHLDWNYPIVGQQNAYFSQIEGILDINRGRVFGGSSVLNSMNYYRENPEYFGLWKTLYGIENWSFDEVLPFFLKSENNLDPLIVEKSNGLHRTGGPLSVSTADPDKMIDRYIKAAQMMGYNKTFTDGREPFGVTIMQRTIKDGIRQSSSVAFLESDYKSNLHTVGYSHVTKILFDDNKRAIGVKFSRNKTEYIVKARKEIIISAGVIGSPQLLMLSGIGPKEHLEALNIPVIYESRVGDNLMQSISFTLNYDIRNQSEIQKPIYNSENEYKYYVEHSGPLTYKLSGLQCLAEVPYQNFTNVSNGCAIPRIVFLDDNLEDLVKNLKLKNEWIDYYRPYLGRAYFTFIALIRKPKSKGTLRLKSNNPFDYPLIDPCIFCDKSDIDDLLEVTKLLLRIYESPYFQQFVQIYNKSIPGCNPCSDNYFCDSYLRCAIQTSTGSIYPVGTCKIGSDNDNNAVVDQRLRVKGVHRLRVIDSSVIPIPCEQVYALSLMVGERGAQFIKDDYMEDYVASNSSSIGFGIMMIMLGLASKFIVN